MRTLGFIIGAAGMALWAMACSGNVTGGGGGGGSAALPEKGTFADACGPTDGPAIAVRIGSPSSCGGATGADPYVQLYAYPFSTKDLVAGQSWTIGQATGNQGISVTWFPDGASGTQLPVQKGSVEVVSVEGSEVVVRYQFFTTEVYAGEVTLPICPLTQPCG